MFCDVTNRATPTPIKARPMTTKPGMTIPADSIGCHAGSLCWVKAVLSGLFEVSPSFFFILRLGKSIQGLLPIRLLSVPYCESKPATEKDLLSEIAVKIFKWMEVQEVYVDT